MKVKSYLIFSTLSLLALAGCKKDDLSDVKLMMEGDPVLAIDDYVAIGSEWTLEAGGIESPTEEDGLGYFWTLKGIVDENDTTDVFSFVFGDEPGVYRLRCTAFHPEYYDNPSTKYITVLDTAFNASLKIGDIPGLQIFTDPRDGIEYRYVTVEGRDWFVTNLRYGAAGRTYMDNPVMWSITGGYYTYDEAMRGDDGDSVCPEGWRVPSEDDWDSLVSAFADNPGLNDPGEHQVYFGAAPALMAAAMFNDEKMWRYSPDCEATNESGFSAIPAGYASLDRYYGINEYAAFWSSEPYGDGGVYHYMYFDNEDLMVSYASGDFRASVRCVRDDI